MRKIFKTIRTKFYKWSERPLALKIDQSISQERLGSAYGGWIIPKGLINTQSVCYLVGAGEDISFDLALADRYKCAVHIFDPTPRAIKHVELVCASLEAGEQAACATAPGGLYPPYPPVLKSLIHLQAVGVWNEDTVLRFFAPGNEQHVSHSLVNLQQTENYIEVPVKRLKTIMKELGHDHIDLMKLDIEGAEYQVLDAMLEDDLKVDMLCIEYDESAANHFDSGYLKRIEASLQRLVEKGYVVFAKEPNCHNYSLIHQRRLSA